MRRSSRRAGGGFTLVEMAAVLAITAVVAAGVAVFLRGPLLAYQDAQRRVAISDAADTAFTRLKRDLQTALPNSVRVTSAGAVFYLEFLQTRTGGRYRAADSTPAAPTGGATCPDVDANTLANENVLEFGVADTCFTTIGALSDLNAIVANSDFVVIYNLGPGFPGADAYASGSATGGNKALVLARAPGGGGENVIRFQSHTFTLDSPGRRFFIISAPVSYVCDPAAGTLRRVSNYAISAAQPAPPAGASALLAKGITDCTIGYDRVNERTGVISIWLRFADPSGGGKLDLFQQVQVGNVP